MGPLYEGTIWLAIALLSILIPIYVFAAPQISRAREIGKVAIRAAEERAREELSEIKEEVSSVQQKLSNQNARDAVRQLRASMKRLQRSEKTKEREIRYITTLPTFFWRNKNRSEAWRVIPPVCHFQRCRQVRVE